MIRRIAKLTTAAAVLLGGLLAGSPSVATTQGTFQGRVGAPGFKMDPGTGKRIWADYPPVSIIGGSVQPGAAEDINIATGPYENAYVVAGTDFRAAQNALNGTDANGAPQAPADVLTRDAYAALPGALPLADTTRFVVVRKNTPAASSIIFQVPYDPRVTSVTAANRLGGQIATSTVRTLLIAARSASSAPPSGILFGSDGFIAYKTDYMERVADNQLHAFGYCGDDKSIRKLLVTSGSNTQSYDVFDPAYRFETCSDSLIGKLLSPIAGAEVDSDARYAYGISLPGANGNTVATGLGGTQPYQLASGPLTDASGSYTMPYAYAENSQFKANIWAVIRYRPFVASGPGAGFAGTYYTSRLPVQAGSTFAVTNTYSANPDLSVNTLGTGPIRTGLDFDTTILDTHAAREANIAVPVAFLQGDAELRNEAPLDNAVPIGDPEGVLQSSLVSINDHDNQTRYTYAKPDFTASGGGSGSGAADAGAGSDVEDREHHGLLAEINRVDLNHTDVYVFAPDGQMLFQRQDLVVNETDGLTCDRTTNTCTLDPSGVPYPARFHPDAIIPFQSTLSDVKVVLLNRATGYIGTSRATIGPGTPSATGSSSGQATLRFEKPVILRPPNLKVRVERNAGTATHLVGSEGSTLTSDKSVNIITEWFDWDGSPLPDSLPGYTGRLAVATPGSTNTSTTTLSPVGRKPDAAAGSGHPGLFEIRPGRDTQVLVLPGGSDAYTAHYYVQIDGHVTLPEFKGNFNEPSASSNLLKYRPRVYVPFLVPRLDDKATKAARDLAAQQNLSVVPAAVYTWMYRPEMQFSMFKLQAALNVTAEGTTDPTRIDLTDPNNAHPLSATTLRDEFVYGITPPTTPMIEQTGPARTLVFDVGGTQFTAIVDQNTHQLDFSDPTVFDKLSASDLLTIRLYQQNDSENVLWSNEPAKIKVTFENGRTNVMQGDRVKAIATTDPATMPLNWSISLAEPGVHAHIERDDSDPEHHQVFVAADEGSEEGFVRVRAYKMDEIDLYGERDLYVGCLGCQKNQAARAGLASIDFMLGLGAGTNGDAAGALFLKTKNPTADIFKPSFLSAGLLSSDTEAISDGKGLRQVSAPQSFVDLIAAADGNGYEVRLYKKDAQGAKDDTLGTYAVNAGKEPVATWKVENPTPAATDGKHVKITETRALHPIVTEYDWVDQNNGWTLSKGNGLSTTEQKIEPGANNTRIDTQTTRDANSTIALVQRTTYTTFPWGEAITEQVIDPDQAAVRVATSYYTDPGDGGNANKPKLEEHSDGSWVHFAYDDLGRKITEIRPWLDAPSTSLASGARTTHYDYTPVDGNDTPNPRNSGEPRTVWEEVGGAVISKTFYAYLTQASGDSTQIVERATHGSASYGDPTNEHTETSFNAPGTDFPGSGEVSKRVLPDGRVDTLAYEYGTYDGASFSAGSGKAVRRTTVHAAKTNGQVGEVPFKTTKEINVKDQFGNVVIEETYANTGGGYTLVGSVKRTFDENGHVTSTTQLNGLSSTAHWDCCLVVSQTDELNRASTIIPDDLKRPQTVTTSDGPNGQTMTVTYTYDAAGRVLTQTVSGGGVSQVTSNHYDGAGRLTSQTTPDHLTTTWQYTNGGRTVTVTRPGNRTEVTDHYADGRVKSILGTAVVPQYFTYGIDENGGQYTEVHLGAADSPRYQRTTTDLLGRTTRTEHPGPQGLETTVQSYDARGLLVSTDRPGLAPELYEYDELGNRIRQGLDVDGNGKLEAASSDRVTTSDTHFISRQGDYWLETTHGVYDDHSGTTVTRTERSRLTGFSGGVTSETETVDVEGNVTRTQVILNTSTKTVRRVTHTPASAIDSVETSVNGYVASRDTMTGLHYVIGRDGIGRVQTVTDPRTGTTTTFYDGDGRIQSVQTPDGAVTSYGYDAAGRQNLVTNANGKTVRVEYDTMDHVVHRWGSATLPVELAYDGFGALHTQTTYRAELGWTGATWPSATGGDVTTWNVDAATGLLQSKQDPQSNSVSYTYETGGRVHVRTNSRQATATYGYDQNTGDLKTVAYSDGTPALSFVYDRLGRPKTVTDVTGTRSFEYDEALRVKAETLSDGHVITPKYDTAGLVGRPLGVKLDSAYDVTYGYDTVGRVNNVAWTIGGQSDAVQYAYRPSSDLVDHYSSGHGPAAQYDYEAHRDLRTKVGNTLGSSTVSQYEPAYDALGRVKTLVTQGSALEQTAGAHWIFAYDDRDQLTGAHHYQGTSATDTTQPLSADGSDLNYDAAGNRLTENDATYTPNPLDQYTSRTAPASNQAFTHDADGNLTNVTRDGALTQYTYDGENRLVKVEPQTPSDGDLRGDYKYDYRGRRIAKTTYTRTGGAWVQSEVIEFLWGGWNLLAEIKTPSGGSATTCNYVWGLDVSQSVYGAGGIGGLVASVKSTGVTRYYAYDAHGNVGQVVENGAVVAQYEYDPYGKLTAKAGAAADDNPFRYSTKYFDPESGFYYYGYRFYAPEWGRWTSRDPATDGTNLYGFVGNSPANHVDATGLKVAQVSSAGVIWDLEPREEAEISRITELAGRIADVLTNHKGCISRKDAEAAERLRQELLQKAGRIYDWDPTQPHDAGFGVVQPPLAMSPGNGTISSALDSFITGVQIEESPPPAHARPPIYLAARVHDAIYSKQCSNALECGVQLTVGAPFGDLGLGFPEAVANKFIEGGTDLRNGHTLRGVGELAIGVILARFSVESCESRGIEFNGKVYRYSDPEYVQTTWDIGDWNIEKNHRYSDVGMGAVYGATSADTALFEASHYGPLDGKVLVSRDVSVTNVLDLTDASVRQSLGITLGDIAGASYDTTHQLGVWAKAAGYNGILAPSARLTGGTNLVMFYPP